VSKFYKEREIGPEQKVTFELKAKKEDEKEQKQMDTEGGLYKRNEARFFGEKQEDRSSSRGSVFQKNAAHFYGYDTPSHGERPFDVPPPEPKAEPTTKPVLAQRKVLFSGLNRGRCKDNRKIRDMRRIRKNSLAWRRRRRRWEEERQ